MGIFKLLGKYGIKALKYLAIAAKKGAVTLGKGAVEAIKFLQAHPALFYNLTSMAVGATVSDVVNQYAASKGIKTNQVEKFLGYVNELEAELNGLGNLDQFFGDMNAEGKSPDKNHPDWWFAPSVKVAYFAPEDFVAANNRLRPMTVHTLGFYAPFELTEIAQQSVYKAYLEYYKRLNIGVTTTTVQATGAESTAVAQVVVPPHTQEEVLRDVKKIIEYSFRGVTNLLELQRMESGYEIASNGSYSIPFGLLGFADINAPNNKAWKNADGSATPLFPSCMYPVNTTEINEFFGYHAFQVEAPGPVSYLKDANDTEALRVAHGQRYNYGNISNASWKSLVARAHRDFYISDKAWQFARYLFEGIFVDQPKEDNPEAYVFVSDTTDGDSGETWYKTNGADLLQSVKDCCSEIEDVVESDRAYENILLHLNVSPYSDKAAEFYRWEFRRDLEHTTLIIKDTDESFYAALQNAAVMIRFPGESFTLQGISASQTDNPFAIALPTCREIELGSPNSITSWKVGGVQRGTIYYGERKPIKDIKTMYNILPDLTSEDAGKIASVTKFGGMARLRYYSRLVFDDVFFDTNPKNRWILTYFDMTHSTVVSASNNSAWLKHGEPKGAPLSELARKSWNFQSRMSMDRGSFSVNNGYIIFAWGVDNSDDPRVGWINRFSNPGYRRVDVTNIDTVLLYQYSNLFMGVNSNEELIQKLEVVKDWYKTSN